MIACSRCGLRVGCGRVVPGEGNAEAEIMFIGEGPGRKEDELGRPFVGAAGKFLDEMLASIGLKRKDVYIANAVKCRPPNNRDPLPEEIEVCWPWLLGQIKIIGPKLIIFLGRHSMNKFFPNEKISEMHGKLLIKKFGLNRFQGNLSPELFALQKVLGDKKQHFLALYHPASALYNGGMREVLENDFKKIPKALEVAKK